ncbi:MAG TPA: hypothetical protein VKJ65_05730 [Phycisphaerae bacterium]|nr:hypothetical protein [Phycisphaerae bacterium]
MRYSFFSFLFLAVFVVLPLWGCAPRDTWPVGITDADRAALAAARLDVEPWPDGPDNGVIIYTAHYRIHTTLEDPAIRQMLARVLEADYARFIQLVPNVGVLPPLDGYVFSDRAEWEEYVVETTGDQASTYLHINEGGFTRQGVFATFRASNEEVLSVVGHEAWHQFSYWALKDHLPAWIDEGLGTQNEEIHWVNGEPVFTPWLNQERWNALKAAVQQDNLLPMQQFASIQAGDVVVMQPEYVQAYYAELWSVTLYIQSTSYRQDLLAMLDDARVGKLTPLLAGTGLTAHDLAIQSIRWNQISGPIYMKDFFGPDLDNFDQGYLNFVQRLIVSWPPAEPDNDDTLLGAAPPAGSRNTGGPL